MPLYIVSFRHNETTFTDSCEFQHTPTVPNVIIPWSLPHNPLAPSPSLPTHRSSYSSSCSSFSSLRTYLRAQPGILHSAKLKPGLCALRSLLGLTFCCTQLRSGSSRTINWKTLPAVQFQQYFMYSGCFRECCPDNAALFRNFYSFTVCRVSYVLCVVFGKWGGGTRRVEDARGG